MKVLGFGAAVGQFGRILSKLSLSKLPTAF